MEILLGLLLFTMIVLGWAIMCQLMRVEAAVRENTEVGNDA
jgi:hypothetical protein